MAEQPQRRVRGKATCGFLSSLKDGQKLDVECYAGVPSGKHRKWLVSLMGVLARDGNMFPLDTSSLSEMDNQKILDARREVEHTFNLPPCENWFKESLGKKWGDNKSKLRTKWFVPFTTTAERYANCPKDVVESQWRALVEYWETEEGKVISKRNSQNRSQLRTPHTIGTKPFVTVWQELASISEVPVSRATHFKITHSHKDESAVNEEAAEKIAQMDESTMKLNEEGKQDRSGQNDVYGQVSKEPPGKIHCYGMGVKRGVAWEEDPSSSTSRPASKPDSDSKKLNKELIVVKKTCSKQAVTIAKQRRQIRRLNVAFMSFTGKPSILDEDDDDDDENEDEEEEEEEEEKYHDCSAHLKIVYYSSSHRLYLFGSLNIF